MRLRESGDARAQVIAEIIDLNRRTHTLAAGIVGPSQLPDDLTMRQMRVLGIVTHEPGMATSDLGHRLGVSAPTASGLVERLTAKGLLTRTDDPTDRRIHRLSLTDAGREVVDGMDTVLERFIDTVLPLISLEDLQEIRHASQILSDLLARAADES